MKKKLNTVGVTNELAESVFFRPQPSQPLEKETKQEVFTLPSQTIVNQEANQPVPPTVPVPLPVPLIPKVKRVIRQRQPFDIYEDQYQRLKKIAETERAFVNGRGMSQMVREAIDNYLRDHCSSEE